MQNVQGGDMMKKKKIETFLPYFLAKWWPPPVSLGFAMGRGSLTSKASCVPLRLFSWTWKQGIFEQKLLCPPNGSGRKWPFGEGACFLALPLWPGILLALRVYILMGIYTNFLKDTHWRRLSMGCVRVFRWTFIYINIYILYIYWL